MGLRDRWKKATQLEALIQERSRIYQSFGLEHASAARYLKANVLRLQDKLPEADQATLDEIDAAQAWGYVDGINQLSRLTHGIDLDPLPTFDKFDETLERRGQPKLPQTQWNSAIKATNELLGDLFAAMEGGSLESLEASDFTRNFGEAWGNFQVLASNGHKLELSGPMAKALGDLADAIEQGNEGDLRRAFGEFQTASATILAAIDTHSHQP